LIGKRAKYQPKGINYPTAKETLSVYHDSKPIGKFDYPLPKTSIDLSEIDL